MDTLFTVGSPAVLPLVPGFLETTDVTQFQTTIIDFINLCHPALEWNFYLGCLGDSMVQPRAATELVLNRTQNSTGLLQAGTSGALPLLAIFGANDKLILKQPVLDAIAGWQKLTVVTLPNAEHFTWISQPVLFRTTILQWISGNA
jgi:pimeloyl-ACP methyl ester carboxylesterase